MKQLLKRNIKKAPFYYLLRNWMAKRRQGKELLEWERKGKPAPPPHIVKQKVLKQHAQEYGLKILVETGTYMGDMCEAMKHFFDRIYSIELGYELFENAQKRFKSFNQIEIIHGDSGKELGRLMSNLDRATLFFLDGHYSGGTTAKGGCDTPIFEELSNILRVWSGTHVIIIDDARYFGTDPAYPTMDELKKLIYSKIKNVDFNVKDDMIRIVPR